MVAANLEFVFALIIPVRFEVIGIGATVTPGATVTLLVGRKGMPRQLAGRRLAVSCRLQAAS